MRETRRRFLAACSSLLAGCAARGNPATAGPGAAAALHLPNVRVSADRVIRTIAGLRPVRPSGFVVRGEKLDAKTVIHNYGHGGAGITLSWGTSQLAVEEGAKAATGECAVLAVERLRDEIGIPGRLRDLGVREEQLRPFAEKAAGIKRILRVNPRPVTVDDLEGILRAAW